MNYHIILYIIILYSKNLILLSGSICMERKRTEFSFGILLLVTLDNANSWWVFSKTLRYENCFWNGKFVASDYWLHHPDCNISALYSCVSTTSSRFFRSE